MTSKREIEMAIDNDRWANWTTPSDWVAGTVPADPNFQADDHDLTDYCGLQADDDPNDENEEMATGYYNRRGDWVSFDGAELLDDCDDSIAIDDDDLVF